MNITKDKRPWGEEEILTNNEKTTVKILTINPEQRSSLQYHYNRKEFWEVIEGELIVEIDNKKVDAKVGDKFEIEAEIKHRLNGKNTSAKILEISFGNFDENDIVRLEDDYGRIQ